MLQDRKFNWDNRTWDTSPILSYFLGNNDIWDFKAHDKSNWSPQGAALNVAKVEDFPKLRLFANARHME